MISKAHLEDMLGRTYPAAVRMIAREEVPVDFTKISAALFMSGKTVDEFHLDCEREHAAMHAEEIQKSAERLAMAEAKGASRDPQEVALAQHDHQERKQRLDAIRDRLLANEKGS